MAFCDSCGKPVYRLDRTCANCGAPVAPNGQTSYGNSSSRGRMNDDYSMSSGYDVLSSWGFVGSMLLMSIPIIGLILTIVWASGGTANLNRRNFARGYLILAGIAILLYIALILILVANGSSLNQIYNRFY